MIVLIFLFPIPSPSMAKEQSVSLNFWPFFQYTSDPVEGMREIEGLGPLFLWKREAHRGQWGIRPFLYWTDDGTESLKRLEFFYPIGKYQVKKGERRGYLFPLSLYKEEDLDGKKKWDFQFFPFFIGETKEGEDYFGLFPFFGTLLDRYGKKEIIFYLWPLYSESKSEGVRTRNWLWPFFSFIEGERKKGYRFWPIYGQKEEVGISKSEFFFWPIFLKKKKGLDTDDPIDERMVFPFYVSKESKRFESKTYMWPLFSHARDRLTGFEQWDLPWPFFQSLKGENLEGIRIFPLYGYKVRKGVMKRTFILYPLYQLEEDRAGDIHEKTTRILLLIRIRTGEGDSGLEKERSLRIWPLFEYMKEETGHTELSFPYLLPYKDEGFERNLFPLFRLFHWEKDPRGSISTNLLWGFYKRKKGEEMESWEVSHLISMKREEGRKTLSFLKGLFWYRSDGETAALRLFYLPFPFRWSHQRRGDFKSIQKELADEQQENRNLGNRLVCSGEGSIQQ